ncbi:MAG: hypothetical protein AAF528_00100 [Cyanobacteria bacterium P01_C01_bin.121]
MVEHGLEHGASFTTDEDIATRMHIAGYSPQEIAHAVQEGSLNIHDPDVTCDSDGHRLYGAALATVISSHEKVRETTYKFTRYKSERGLDGVRRLDALGLATNRLPQFHNQSMKGVQPDQSIAVEL